MIRFTEDDVLTLLPMPDAIECLRKAFVAYDRGEAQNQPRRRLILPTGSVLHSMAAAYGAYFGTKVYSTHVKYGAYFTFLLYDAETARPLAQFEANHLGQIRTGAASGLAADLLAPDRPVTVGIIGSGFQAGRRSKRFDVCEGCRGSESGVVPERRESFAADTGAEVAASAEEACEGADIIVTATHSKDPVIRRSERWIRDARACDGRQCGQPPRGARRGRRAGAYHCRRYRTMQDRSGGSDPRRMWIGDR